jgi:flagellar motor switch protein FliM
MAEVISQQKLDALLNNVKSGVESARTGNLKWEAVLFDFRLPNRIRKTTLRTIRTFTKYLQKTLASFLVSKLQSIVTINLAVSISFIIGISFPYQTRHVVYV